MLASFSFAAARWNGGGRSSPQFESEFSAFGQLGEGERKIHSCQRNVDRATDPEAWSNSHRQTIAFRAAAAKASTGRIHELREDAWGRNS